LDESEIAGVKTISELERVVGEPLFTTEAQRHGGETFRNRDKQAVRDPSLSPRSAGENQRKYEYPRWAQRWPITWIRLVVYYMLTWPATWLLAWPRVIGREKLRDVRGPVLVVCNHVTYIDVGFVLAALPWRLRNKLAVAMEGERLWAMRSGGWPVRLGYFLVVALFNVFPLPKLSGFRESFAFAGESVGRGYSVLVFPEGLRARTGEMQKFQSGIGMLSTGLDVPVGPMRIDGLFAVKEKYFVRDAVTVRVGEALRVDKNKSAEEIARELEERVKGL
jgi:long-chain acyl-CoA synthetase